jgi:hypothetical protein
VVRVGAVGGKAVKFVEATGPVKVRWGQDRDSWDAPVLEEGEATAVQASATPASEPSQDSASGELVLDSSDPLQAYALEQDW